MDQLKKMLELTKDVKAPVFISENSVAVRSTKEAFAVALDSIQKLVKKNEEKAIKRK